MADAAAPKVTFHITPAKPKGTLADFDAGNLPPPNANGEGEVPRAPTVATGKRGSRLARRKPNPPKQDAETERLRQAVRVEEEIEAPAQGQPSPHERVLADLEFKRRQIDIAIKALRELYE